MHRPEPGDVSKRAARLWFLAQKGVDVRRLSATVAFAAAGYCASAQAERWSLEPGIDARATWTDNVNFEVHGQEASDTIFELIPTLALRGEGKRFRIAGTISVDALAYARHTLDNRALPQIDLTSNLEAIERFFFIEAGIASRQGAQDVFGPRADGGSSFNTVTTTQYRLVPSFEGRLGSNIDYRLRSSNSWTQTSGAEGASADGSYLGEHTLRISQRPLPFGWSLDVARTDTRFEAADQPSAIDDSARLSTVYAFAPTFNTGIHG